jgi:AAA family ATP:ADP antiporter
MPERAARTVYLANINFWVNTIALIVQVFFTGKFLKWLGITFTLLPLPIIAMVGFAALAMHPSLEVLMLMTICAKSCEYATARPARETLYTVVSRAEKYQAKSFIDTFIYRGGDWLGGLFFHQLFSRAVLSLGGMAWLAVPLAGAWTGIAYALGRRQEALAKAAEVASAAASGGGISARAGLESEHEGA